ncbi:MAG: hypothetical protein A2096_00050 [Spirochaetes bacterium GWF1_41_5]|nr:MAG: hypothetical protein A2096_00050 [Spirochaetes bacterium GWF1_41_5]HBE02916.1 fluoride efflux transporter CrcB [Spirochaetia bacterium]
MEFLIVAVGGCLGAISRYAVSKLTGHYNSFPWATLLVNIGGSFLIGCFSAWSERFSSADYLRLFLTVGFLGAFTTFSAFSGETLLLFRSGFFITGFFNIALNLIGSLTAVFGAFYITKFLI